MSPVAKLAAVCTLLASLALGVVVTCGLIAVATAQAGVFSACGALWVVGALRARPFEQASRRPSLPVARRRPRRGLSWDSWQAARAPRCGSAQTGEPAGALRRGFQPGLLSS